MQTDAIVVQNKEIMCTRNAESEKVFLERRLSFPVGNTGGFQSLYVRFFQPQQGATEWVCNYELTSDDCQFSGVSYGEDGLQAFLGALELARKEIAEKFPAAFWLERTPSSTGMPIIFQPFLPHAQSQTLFRFLDNQVAQFMSILLDRDRKDISSGLQSRAGED